jgi:hypothetical protein
MMCRRRASEVNKRTPVLPAAEPGHVELAAFESPRAKDYLDRVQ